MVCYWDCANMAKSKLRNAGERDFALEKNFTATATMQTPRPGMFLEPAKKCPRYRRGTSTYSPLLVVILVGHIFCSQQSIHALDRKSKLNCGKVLNSITDRTLILILDLTLTRP